MGRYKTEVFFHLIMSREIRESKFRHVFGDLAPKKNWFHSLKLSGSIDTDIATVNPRYLGVLLYGINQFSVLPLEGADGRGKHIPLITGHKGTVLNLEFHPHNDNIIASSSSDLTIKVWVIPDGGLQEDMSEAAYTLTGHRKDVE